jgi:integrase
VTIWKTTKFPGVRYKEPGTRRFKGRPEKYYSIRYRRGGKLVEEGAGWESAGVNPQSCSQERTQIVQNIRVGEGYFSLKTKREIEEAKRLAKIEEKEATERDKTPLSGIAEKYLEWSKHNKKSWKDDLSRYRNHVKPVLGHYPIKNIGIIQLESLKKKLKAKGISEQTVLHCLTLVSAIFNRASSWGLYQGENPVRATVKADKKFLKIPDASRKAFLTQDQADTLLDDLKARSPQLHDMSLLSLYTGARAGEIFNLVWADIDLKNKFIILRDTKNGDTRNLFMTPQVEKMLKERIPEHMKKNELVFKNRNGKQIQEVSNAFSRAIHKLGFNQDVTDRRHKIVFHSLRHTFGSWLALQGTPIFNIKELMGHRKIEMTMVYAHLLPDEKRKAVLELGKRQGQKVVELKKNRRGK